ncbi:hypothetical protein Aple_025740 [Acrocarpospora pleiomorpha]|uniref:Uncharacterized protein n=1 Tax=Acrocarpospora pleiomorpha TaxID=90975 RepID=A0A5M3XNB0_9ACTN|nr:hypothetical protein [Acrocarpospora pleiomorpha]GES19678.1 hypothetical protein Aple_025740 [Acrocarpospora pleiomorpha]
MIIIQSSYRAEDAAYLALADAATIVPHQEWRVIGGHMVNLHVLHAGLDLPLRATRDADLAVEVLTVRQGSVVDHLHALGYTNTSNRFTRIVGAHELTIDLLVPSTSTRHEPNVDVGPIVADGVPGLSVSLARPGLRLPLRITLSTGTELPFDAIIPDLASALALKIFSYGSRFATRDEEDIKRLLKIAHATGLNWPSSPTFRDAARVVHRYIDTRAQRDAELRALARTIVGRA